MRSVHRVLALFALLFGIYIALTGLGIQGLDLSALLRHAPATDPTMQAIRVGHDGPPNFQVISTGDYAAPALPLGLDWDAALAATARGARATLGTAPLRYVELRMRDGRPVGEVLSRGLIYRFDPSSASLLAAPARAVLPPLSLPSFRNTIKDIHRMRVYGQAAIAVDVMAGLTLCVLIVSGLTMYWRVLAARRRIGRTAPFWRSGGWWRTLHRAVALTAALFLTVVTLSGIVLGTSSVGVAAKQALHHGKRPGLTADVSAPLSASALPHMLHTTLAAFRSTDPSTPIKVLRLRYFAGMPQGIIITGGASTEQRVFNAATGRAVSESEPGYPDTDMPFGWQADQIAKQIHRGDYFGLSGRWMSVVAGLALLYLSVSGAVMYFELWSRRRKSGRRALIWS